MPGTTLDTGALIAVERGDRRMQALLQEAEAARAPILVPAACLAQAWRGTARQARLARLLALRHVDVADLDEATAKAAGALCGRTGTLDVVDAAVVVTAKRQDHTVVTSDPDDLRRLDPTLRIVTV